MMMMLREISFSSLFGLRFAALGTDFMFGLKLCWVIAFFTCAWLVRWDCIDHVISRSELSRKVYIKGFQAQGKFDPQYFNFPSPCHLVSSCFQSLRNPLRLKYSCSSQSTWKLAVDSLMTVTRKGLNVALARPGKLRLRDF